MELDSRGRQEMEGSTKPSKHTARRQPLSPSPWFGGGREPVQYRTEEVCVKVGLYREVQVNVISASSSPSSLDSSFRVMDSCPHFNKSHGRSSSTCYSI